MRSLEAVERDLGSAIQARLKRFVSEGGVGGGAPFEELDLDELDSVQIASDLAAEAGEREIGEGHLFLAVLSSASSTVTNLEERLGDGNMARLKRFVSAGGPPAVSTGDIDF